MQKTGIIVFTIFFIVVTFSIAYAIGPRSRLTGAGFKPPKAALVKSQGGERL